MVACLDVPGLDQAMAKFTKLSVQVPPPVRERFIELEHGQKQLVVSGALIWYFNADQEAQRVYRAWAQSVAEGHATIEEPPRLDFPRARRKAPTRRAKKR